MMLCPNCQKEMVYQDKGYYGFAFSTGPEPDYPQWLPNSTYICKQCKIKYKNDQWIIPKKYERPTEKQIRTILFINHHLRTNYEPLLKKQCWYIINQNMQKAIDAKNAHDETMAEMHREMYGEWDYY